MLDDMPAVLQPSGPSRDHRYALYFAPQVGSLWWQAGSGWLGRCAAGLSISAPPTVPGLSATELHRLTAAPRRYGWHATLKAPFTLRPDADLQTLRIELRRLCARLQPFVLPRLQVTVLDDFLALVPMGDSSAINAVANACVRDVHPLAATLSAQELQRRRSAGLTPDEDTLLLQWGYPFVMARFRFHMSLTGSLRGVDPDNVAALQDAACRWFDPLPLCPFDNVALFAEPTAGADFVLLESVPLG
jgi:hypothetical protein